MDMKRRSTTKRRRGGGFECEYCGEDFPRKRDLDRHQRGSTECHDKAVHDVVDLHERSVSSSHRSGERPASIDAAQDANDCSMSDLAILNPVTHYDMVDYCPPSMAESNHEFVMQEDYADMPATESAVIEGQGWSVSGSNDFPEFETEGHVVLHNGADFTSFIGDHQENNPAEYDGQESHDSWACQKPDEPSLGFDMVGLVVQEDGRNDLGAAESSPVHDAEENDALHGPAGLQDAIVSDDVSDSSSIPQLGDIHRVVGAKLRGRCVEGHRVKQRQFGRDSNREYSPFKNLTELLLFVFAVKHQLSRVATTDLFSILRFEDRATGEGEQASFNVSDVPLNGGHFVSRMREYLPLFEVWVRDVPSKKSADVGDVSPETDGGVTDAPRKTAAGVGDAPADKNTGAAKTVQVYDIPITHILDHLLKSPSMMGEMRNNPGGAVVEPELATRIGLLSEHIFPIATLPCGGARRNYMHGRIASAMPQFNSDGFKSRAGRRVYISDTVMCDMRKDISHKALQVPCRVVRTYFDEERRALIVVVRSFRTAKEVRGIAEEHPRFMHQGFVRVWEEHGRDAEIPLVGVDRVLDLCEVLSREDVETVRKGNLEEGWYVGCRQRSWTFVGEGFVVKKGSRFREDIKKWRRAGAEDENFLDMRDPGVHHNSGNRPFLNLTTGIYVDDFNVWGMTNPHSEGASYFALLSLDRRIQRLARHLHPTTMASPGAHYDAAMAFSCTVIGKLQKGCFADIIIPDASGLGSCRQQVFARGGLQAVIGDAPQRAGLLKTKTPNGRTLHPCSLCNVTQSPEEGALGGDLGDSNYDVDKHRRTRGQVLERRGQLAKEGKGGVAELSKELGVMEPDVLSLPCALYDLVSMHQPMESCCPELLHQNHLNHLGLVQSFFLGLLSDAGREHVSSLLRPGSHLYGPGSSPLKDVVSKYVALSGSQKAFFASIQLLVFRLVLSSVRAMTHFMKTATLNQMRRKVWGSLSDEDVLERLKGFLRVSSDLSFAARVPQYTDADLRDLHHTAKEYVGAATLTLGRTGVRTSTHNWLHWSDTIRNHGAPLDASVGEQGHQRHKRSNKSGSGRDPAAHHARRVNTLMALRRLSAPGDSWQATRYNFSTRKHVTRDVQAGTACTRVLATLAGTLRGGIESPRDPDLWSIPTEAAAQGAFPASAQWQANILGCRVESDVDADQSSDGGRGWEACIAQSGIVPHQNDVLGAAREWYGCGRTSDDNDNDFCGKERCPACREESGDLLNDSIICTRFKHGLPPRVSSGRGYLKGGHVKTATNEGPYPRAWAFGDGSGEDVEIYRTPDARDKGLAGDRGVTLAKIMYFFDHKGNKWAGAVGEGGITEYVLVYEYVTRGRGKNMAFDRITGHPTYYLQAGRGATPSVYPVEAIRRHVHMFHMCPSRELSSVVGQTRLSDEPLTTSSAARNSPCCGLATDHGGKEWKHHFILAQAKECAHRRDSYVLNTHWDPSFSS